jgi:hypothetical protein
MSRDVLETLPIGPCRAYWADVRLGSPMTQVTLRINRESVQYGLEDRNVNVGSHVTKDICEIDLVISDLKPHQLRYSYAQAESKESSTTIQSEGYSSTVTSFVHRYSEHHKLTGTTTITIDGAGYETGTIKVFKSDLSNTPDGYTKGTDYTASSETGNVKRIDAGDITDGDTVLVEYNQSATSAVTFFGGQLADYEGELRITHELDNGKHLTIVAPRAKRIGASEFAIQMQAQFGGIAMTFHCLADMTQPPGRQLVQIAIEA